ncbi:hypothetical protein J6Q66_07290 [bacterium]|nr:hypothetical protein [bacterium]
MISAVSFGSTYKINHPFTTLTSKKMDATYDLLDKCEQRRIRTSETMKTDSMSVTIVSPDCLDSYIETLCANRGIEFKKITNDELMDKDMILSRVQKAPEKMIKAKINAEKFEKLVSQHPESNIKYCQKEYDRYFEDATNFMLKKGSKFPATTMYITTSMDKEDAILYKQMNGVENFNKNSIQFNFAQRTNDPDHCVYFAMKEAGIKNIPVYMSQDTYDLAKAFEIIEE